VRFHPTTPTAAATINGAAIDERARRRLTATSTAIAMTNMTTNRMRTKCGVHERSRLPCWRIANPSASEYSWTAI